MSYYENIYEYASDNYGLITSKEALNIGIPNIELVKLSERGRLTRVGHGVYRIKHYIPTPLDRYAEAAAIAGRGAFIYGESVLAMHGLALVNPSVIYVAITGRLRKSLPEYIAIKSVETGNEITEYENIPSQSVFDAIITCLPTIMRDRLSEAAAEAEKLGLISREQAVILERKILNEPKASEQQKES